MKGQGRIVMCCCALAALACSQTHASDDCRRPTGELRVTKRTTGFAFSGEQDSRDGNNNLNLLETATGKRSAENCRTETQREAYKNYGFACDSMQSARNGLVELVFSSNVGNESAARILFLIKADGTADDLAVKPANVSAQTWEAMVRFAVQTLWRDCDGNLQWTSLNVGGRGAGEIPGSPLPLGETVEGMGGACISMYFATQSCAYVETEGGELQSLGCSYEEDAIPTMVCS